MKKNILIAVIAIFGLFGLGCEKEITGPEPERDPSILRNTKASSISLHTNQGIVAFATLAMSYPKGMAEEFKPDAPVTIEGYVRKKHTRGVQSYQVYINTDILATPTYIYIHNDGCNNYLTQNGVRLIVGSLNLLKSTEGIVLHVP